MDITPYVDALRHDLAAAAGAGGPETAAAAERLLLALDPAVRLAVMDALSQAAAEITADLPAGSVEVRLRGREPQLVVDVPAGGSPAAAPAPPDAEDGESVDDSALARITLRLPETVKARAEELAARSGQSLNTWIVAAVRAATRTSPTPADGGDVRSSRRMTGWV